MKEGLNISVWHEPPFDTLCLTFFTYHGGKVQVAEPIEFIFREVDEDTQAEPTLKLNAFIAQDFLKTLADALDSYGVKTDKDAKIEGTLDATKYHLEDLRELLDLDADRQPKNKDS